jgi:hypothetical protein
MRYLLISTLTGILASFHREDEFELFDDLLPSSVEPIPTIDWCIEYEELNFKLVSATVSENSLISHREYLDDSIAKILHIINNAIAARRGPRMTISNAKRLSELPWPNWTEYIDRLMVELEKFRDPPSHENVFMDESINHVVSLSLDFNAKVLLFAHFVTRLSEFKTRLEVDVVAAAENKARVLETITTNRAEIERCLTSKVALVQTQIESLRERVRSMNALIERFTTIRLIVEKAILDKPKLRFSSIPRSECLASVRSVMLDRSLPESRADFLPSLQKNLGQHNWSFLITWLEELDTLQARWGKEIEQGLNQIEARSRILSTIGLESEKMIRILAKTVS